MRVVADLTDSAGQAIADAAVSIDLWRGETIYASSSGKTGMDGTVTFKFNNAPAGTYKTTVRSVEAEGLTWDGTTPLNEFNK